MPTQCPQCLSPRTRERHLGKQLGAAIGAVVGALSGAIASASGIRLSNTRSPTLRAVGLPGVVASAIAGGLAGSAAGAALGETLEAEFFDTHFCLSCGNTFRPTRFERPMWDHR